MLIDRLVLCCADALTMISLPPRSMLTSQSFAQCSQTVGELPTSVSYD